MSYLYIANATRQRHVFAYRVPDDDPDRKQRETPYTQPIEPGGQVRVSKSLSTPQIDAIVAQHEIYGMVRFDQIDNTRGVCGLCYSVDKPVPLETIQRLVHRNDLFIAAKGQKMREEAALAVHASIQQTFREEAIPGNVNSLEMSVDEEERGSRPDDIKPVAEGVQVTPFVQGRRVVPSGPGGRPATGREDAAPRRGRKRA